MGPKACLANFLQATYALIIGSALFLKMGNGYRRFTEMFDDDFQ